MTNRRVRCEKLQVSCDEAAGASDRHQAALAKQVEANKVLDNDLKLMCAARACCLPLCTCGCPCALVAAPVHLWRIRHVCCCRYRKHKKDTAELEDKYKRDDYGRRYA